MNEQKKETKPCDMGNIPLEGIKAIYETTKSEYENLKKSLDGLYTRVGILLTLLTALITAAFATSSENLRMLFQNGSFLNHLKAVCMICTFVSFVVTLFGYVRVLFTNKYHFIDYSILTKYNEDDIVKATNQRIIISLYKLYAACIPLNEVSYAKKIKLYKFANIWLIVTMAFAIACIVVNII